MPTRSDEHWERLQMIVDAALDAAPAERARLLDELCRSDPALRAEAARLLASCDRAGDFLERPAAELAIPLWREAAPGRADSPPERIGPYRIVQEAGRGGMGTVYLAERDDGHFRKRVALKLVRPGAGGEAVLHRFLEERQILARLEHPNIARLIDGGATDAGEPYLVMEFVHGLPIDRYCDERRLGIAARLALFTEVCNGVQYAHQSLVVHRDLKPGNILVTPQGVPKLLDFGIARLLDAPWTGGALTRTGVRPMTPEYASPEQVNGGSITTASDIYALGVLLYRLVCGRHPYATEGRTLHEVERAVLEHAPLPPSAVTRLPLAAGDRESRSGETLAAARDTTPDRLRRRLRGDLDAIVLRALRKEPTLRYATAQQLADDIGRHLEGRPVLARRGTRLYNASRLARRHRVAVVGAGLVVAALIGGATTTTWQARVAGVERDRARAEAATAARVSAYLEDLFRVSDPTEGRGAAVTARELLDRGAERIERELAAEPASRAALMAVMGRAYGNLGEYARAATLLERTLETRRAMPVSAHAELAETLLDLAHVRAAQGNLGAAEGHAREALRLSRRPGRADDGEGGGEAAALAALGEILHQKGELAAAEAHLREALATRKRLLGTAHPEVASTLNALAHLLRTRGQLVAAEPIYREALAIERQTLGDDHPDVGTTLNDLAVLLYERNDYPGSEALMREALALQRSVLGSDHPEVAKTINNLAAVLEKEGKLAEAEPLYREALDLKRASLGNDHVSVSVSMNNLALLLANRGDHVGADSLLRQVLELRRRLLGPDHPSVATALHNLASQADRQGDTASAEALYRRVHSMRERLLGPDHPDLAGTALALGLLRQRSGTHLEAETLLRDALRIRRMKLPPGAWQTAQAESALGACLLDQGETAEAAPLLRSGYETLLRERGPGDRSTLRAQENVARLGDGVVR